MRDTYEYTGINNSSTIHTLAGADLGDAAGRAVTFSETMAVYPAAGEIPAGIVLLTEDEEIKLGADLTIQVEDIGMWKAGAEVALGDLLAVDSDGYCRKAAAGQYVYARALMGNCDVGDLVTVQIIHAGYLQ